MKKITDTLQISRSNQYARGIEKKKRYKPHPDDRKYLPLIRQITDERPTYGYRRVTALLNRSLRANGQPSVITLRSNMRWCSDVFEILCHGYL